MVFLAEHPTLVAICESDLPDGSWKDLLAHLADMNRPPLLIVTSRLADEVLWSEVLNLGGYNVLAKPLVETEVRHVLDNAWRRWTGHQAIGRHAGSA
jgi:DNA-binding response OmpR family regulator